MRNDFRDIDPSIFRDAKKYLYVDDKQVDSLYKVSPFTCDCIDEVTYRRDLPYKYGDRIYEFYSYLFYEGESRIGWWRTGEKGSQSARIMALELAALVAEEGRL